MNRTKSGKILLHTDADLTKEIAEEINKAVGEIGPIQMAGLGLAKKMEHTAEALKEGIEKIEQAEQEFKEAVPDDVLEAAQEKIDVEALQAERDALRQENAELRQKLNFSIGKN